MTPPLNPHPVHGEGEDACLWCDGTGIFLRSIERRMPAHCPQCVQHGDPQSSQSVSMSWVDCTSCNDSGRRACLD
jgi:hypothetical protein